MTRHELHAKAVAYNASRSPRHYQDLRHAEREAFWTEVARLRVRNAITPTRRFVFDVLDPGWETVAADKDRERLRDMFWRDQEGIPS